MSVCFRLRGFGADTWIHASEGAGGGAVTYAGVRAGMRARMTFGINAAVNVDVFSSERRNAGLSTSLWSAVGARTIKVMGTA